MEGEQLIGEVQDALANLKVLRGRLPICAACEEIRDDEGAWHRMEEYIGAHSEAPFTHGVCPESERKFFPQLYQEDPGS